MASGMTHTKDGDDLFTVELRNLQVQHSQSIKEITQLKARLYDAQCQITELKSELDQTSIWRDSTSNSGYGGLAFQQNYQTLSQPRNRVAGPSNRFENTRKRPRSRSLSIEIIEPPRKESKKGDKKQVETKTVSIPIVRTKSDHSFYPTPSPLSCDQPNNTRRRRIEPGDHELEARSVTSQRSLSSSLLSSLSTITPSKSASIAPEEEIKLKYEGKVRVPQSITLAYLSCSPTLVISPPPLLNLLVPRKFLRLAYGGSDQRFIQFIKGTNNPSGPTTRKIIFPMLDMNPAMPVQPGDAGLMFASRHEILSDGPWTVFCKRPETGKALWLYLGEYNNVLCGKMTKEEFGIQRDIVKNEWAKFLLRMKQFDIYVSMRSRIALRKAGVLPVDDPNEAERLVKAEMDNIKANKGTEITEEDIVEALNRGEEGINIIRMTCVKYDHVFANDMKTNFANYDRMLAANQWERGSGGDHDEHEDEDDDGFALRRVRRKGKNNDQGKEKVYYEDNDDSGDYKP